ncbi:inositol monophosphatase family protein [Ktedonobacter robiniae]|uniref:Fructose-1, 6-bisphosphatase/inositol-1-monophosphatase n=1 Tax=Ktedonobacter robiniae TaxID=2778365 RepID=A0ABQ3UXM8_9CHLR|nr:inositol monophosphatase [Ktedonobacter robiniae]GHO57140.1 fructose-1,6-bisphosphatase/inositol-1-monophosphatase [Ktedonobacter robiniae]
MDYQLFLMRTLADASQIALDHFGSVTPAIKDGDTSQVVTEADIEIGRMISEEIKRTYPTHNILDEEMGIVDKHSPYTWVIDPIDGTSNFAQASPLYGCMLGLLKDHKPIAGGFALPAFHEIYTAERGKGAYCNQQRVRVQDQKELLSALVAYGVEGHQEDPNRTRKECELLAEIVLACRGVQTSSSVFDAAMVAKGVYGGFLYQNCKIWDNVAQQILLEEAGVLYTDFFGQPIDYKHPLTKATEMFSFCAAPPALHGQLQQIISTWKMKCTFS